MEDYNMKQIAILAIIFAIALLAYNYYNTGNIELIPRKLTPEETEFKAIEKRLKAIKQEFNRMDSKARASGGVAPQVNFSDADRLKAEREKLEERRAELQSKIRKQ